MPHMLIATTMIYLEQGMERIPFWPFLIVLALTGIVLYLRAVDAQYWNLLLRSTYDSRALSQMLREENIMESSFTAALIFVFFFSMALVLYSAQLSLAPHHIVNHPAIDFIAILLILFVIYVGKVGILFFLQYVFQEKQLFDEYVTVLMNINVVLGIWLLPISLLFYYDVGQSKQLLLIIAAALGFIAFILRSFRIYETGLQHNMKWYNIIAYLCTLEIMPMLLVVMLVRTFGVNLNLG